MNSPQSLPFTMTSEGIAAWINTVNKLDTIPACNELYLVAKKLAKSKSVNDDLVAVLDQLTPSVLQLSNNLNAALITTIDKNGILNKKSRKPARLSGQLIRNHCLAYCQAITHQDLSRDQKIQALCGALQLIGFSLKTHTLISEKPSGTLWQKMGELYRLAVKASLLTVPTKYGETILPSIKRNLLYSLFDLYQAPVDQLAKYYEMADQCAQYLDFSEHSNISCNFYWNTAGSQLPQRGRPISSAGTNLVFNTVAVARHLQEHTPAAEQNTAIFQHIWRILTGYSDIIDAIIPTKPTPSYFYKGLPSIIEQLRQYNRISNIHRLSGHKPTAKALQTLELVPMEHEKRSYQIYSKEQQSLKTDTAYLLPAKNALFFLAQVKTDPLSYNMPVLLISPQMAPTLGIIRTIQITPVSDHQSVLIETLPGKLSLINVTLDTFTTEAILVQHAATNDRLILAPESYKTGDEVIRPDRPHSIFYLSRLLEINDYFRYYQLDAD